MQADHNDITPVFLAVQRGEEGQAAFEWLMGKGARYNEPTAAEAAGAAAAAAAATASGAAAATAAGSAH